MELYAGIDVSSENASICVMDAAGCIVGEDKVATEPEALIARLHRTGFELARIGLEAQRLWQWLHVHLREAGFALELLETRHVRSTFKAMPVKADRKVAHGIAQLPRLGWFRPMHCKSMVVQELGAVFTARKLIQGKLDDVGMSLSGALRGFGLKVGGAAPRRFAARVRDVVAGHPILKGVAAALLAAWAKLSRQFSRFQPKVRAAARCGARAPLMMSTPDVGAIVELTYEGANVILTRPVK